MTREEIIRMAREAGCGWAQNGTEPVLMGEEQLMRFAHLISNLNKPETAIKEAYRCGYEAGSIAARDACIALCEEHWKCGGNSMECADAIRARVQK